MNIETCGVSKLPMDTITAIINVSQETINVKSTRNIVIRIIQMKDPVTSIIKIKSMTKIDSISIRFPSSVNDIILITSAGFRSINFSGIRRINTFGALQSDDEPVDYSFPNLRECYCAKFGTSVGSFYAPNLITTGDYFLRGEQITEAIFPLLNGIGRYSFSTCNKLVRVQMDSLLYAGSLSFWDCAVLREVYMPSLVKAFLFMTECHSVVNLSFPLLSETSNESFGGCTSLETLYAPLAKLDKNVLIKQCPKLKKIIVK